MYKHKDCRRNGSYEIDDPFRGRARKSGSAAFTLVEILAAVFIVALLAVLLVPAIRNGIESAHGAKCLSNLRQFGLAIISYSADHNMSLPAYLQVKDGKYATWNTQGDAEEFPAVGWAWNYLDPPRKMFRCPSDTTKSIRDQQSNPTSAYLSYASNYYFITGLRADGVPEREEYPKIYEARNKMLLCDGRSQSEDPEAGSEFSAQKTIPPGASNANVRKNMSSRHHGGSNFLFGDGSARWIAFDEAIDTSEGGYLNYTPQK